jgi:hypothetical protein
MQEEQKKKWMELCERAAGEQDPKKLAAARCACLLHPHSVTFFKHLPQFLQQLVEVFLQQSQGSAFLISSSRSNFWHNLELLCGLDRYESPVIGYGSSVHTVTWYF